MVHSGTYPCCTATHGYTLDPSVTEWYRIGYLATQLQLLHSHRTPLYQGVIFLMQVGSSVSWRSSLKLSQRSQRSCFDITPQSNYQERTDASRVGSLGITWNLLQRNVTWQLSRVALDIGSLQQYSSGVRYFAPLTNDVVCRTMNRQDAPDDLPCHLIHRRTSAGIITSIYAPIVGTDANL